MELQNKIYKQLYLADQGFTLIEAVIAIIIVGVIGVIMADLLNKAFDTGAKSTLLSTIQQNGRSAMNTIEESIRYSQFICVGEAIDPAYRGQPNLVNHAYTAPILAVFKNGRTIRYVVFPETSGTNGYNGYIQEDFPLYLETTGTTSSAVLCNPTNAAFIPLSGTSSNQRKLTDSANLSVKTAAFTLLSNAVSASGTSKVSVSLKYSLGASRTAANDASNQVGTNNRIDFNSTIQFR